MDLVALALPVPLNSLRPGRQTVQGGTNFLLMRGKRVSKGTVGLFSPGSDVTGLPYPPGLFKRLHITGVMCGLESTDPVERPFTSMHQSQLELKPFVDKLIDCVTENSSATIFIIDQVFESFSSNIYCEDLLLFVVVYELELNILCFGQSKPLIIF